MTEYKIEPGKTYAARPTSCSCGANLAWVKVEGCAETIIGCVCHHTPKDLIFVPRKEDKKALFFLDVVKCQRCGEGHTKLEFYPLNNVVDRYRFWGICPNTNQPILLAITDSVSKIPLKELKKLFKEEKKIGGVTGRSIRNIEKL